MNLEALHLAYESLFGAPDYVLRLSLGEEGASPGRLDIVYDFPKPAEGKLDTTITTLGLALHRMEGPCERAELSTAILGRHSREDNDRLDTHSLALKFLGLHDEELAVLDKVL